jgi:branched-chain amino acid transport system permease protein
VIMGSAFFALLGYLIEKEYTFPITHWKLHIEELLAKIPLVPDLTKEVAPLVLGPILLLLTITVHPGGIGQQLRPLGRWLRGRKLDLHDEGPREVMVADVRA